ncbi:cytochrome P450 CYP12A2-like [Aphomia sociella]
MQTSKLRPVICLATINKNVCRNVAVNSATVKENETTQQTELGKSWREIPGPKSLPVIGQLHHFLPGGSLYKLSSMDFITKIHDEFGPITRLDSLVGSPPLIFLLDPESSAQILRGENWLPRRPGFLSLEYYRHSYKKDKSEFTGLLTDHDEKWKKFRSLVNPALLQPKTIKLYSEVLDEVAQDMINRMKSNRGDDNILKNKLDIEMNLWALESIGVVALGDRLNCLDPNLPENSPARKLIKIVHDFFTITEEIDFKPSLWRYFSTPAYKKAMKSYEDQENLTKYFVDEAIKKLNIKNVKEDEEKGVLEKLLELDKSIAHIMASDMLFAGVDTTANTVIFTLYLLATNPDKQDKLREEIISKAEKRSYLKACIKESLRMLPIVSGNMRQTTKEYNILGYNIPKGYCRSFAGALRGPDDFSVLTRQRNVNVAGNSATIKENETTQVQQGKPWREIPGLKSLPVIGQLYHFLPGGSLYNATSMEFITKMHEMYGPISRVDGLFGAPPIILLLDPESSAQIFRGENWLPERPGFLSLDYYRSSYKKNKSEFGGLLTDHGEKWKKFRSLVNPALLQPKTIKLYSEILDEVAQDMINRMKSNRGDNNKIKNKLDIEMNLWALESIGVVALGDRLNCFDPNLPEDSPARKLIKVVHDFFVVSEDIDFKPSLWRYFSTPAFKRAMKTYKDQDNLTKYFVDEAIKKLKTKNVKEGEEKGVLEKLLELDETIAHIMASDMLFAGVDTTANTMIFTLYLLAANPEKQDKLREEVMSQADKRPYLKACIKESLRVLPVVVGNMRKTTKEYNLLGYNIPKGTFVSFSHELMSKIEAYYPKPEEFIPERWLVGKDDPLYYGNAHPFAHNPFGFGARSCIGRRIAELEIETLLVRLIQNFKIEWFGPPLKIKRTSLNYAAEPFNFIFKDV